MQLRLGMNEVNKILIIEPVRSFEAEPFTRLVVKSGGRPRFGQMKGGRYCQEVTRRVGRDDIFRK